MTEHVILVSEQNEVLGTTPKATVHGKNTPLHRAFSFFLFTEQGDFLLQQRALSKKTWPGIWSNSACGHPQLGEANIDAVRRRLREELNLEMEAEIFEVLPDFQYRAERDGVVENEICPVFAAWVPEKIEISPNPEEVETTEWIGWQKFLTEVQKPTQERFKNFSEWAVEESLLISKSKGFLGLWEQFAKE